jgi:hypothetical protein
MGTPTVADTKLIPLPQAGCTLQGYTHNGRYTIHDFTPGRPWSTEVHPQRPILCWFLFMRPAVPYRGTSPMANTEVYIVDLDIGSACMCPTWSWHLLVYFKDRLGQHVSYMDWDIDSASICSTCITYSGQYRFGQHVFYMDRPRTGWPWFYEVFACPEPWFYAYKWLKYVRSDATAEPWIAR